MSGINETKEGEEEKLIQGKGFIGTAVTHPQGILVTFITAGRLQDVSVTVHYLM